ncbi:MAG: class I SAM-dependent methyltransferase, partial [Bacteroidota bacterium]
LENIINKLSEAKVFYTIFNKYRSLFEESDIILELGGGQGWASCMVKKELGKKIYLSDISEYAIAGLSHWERMFEVQLEGSFACRSYDIPMEDASLDMVFCYAAAHHFVEHQKSIVEINRVLKKGGKCLYMYEPSCKKYIYPYAYRRVNAKRPEVPEDVLIYKDMKSYAEALGMQVQIEFFPSVERRGPVETIYYYLLNKLPFLQKQLPCTCNYVFQKH